MFVFVIISSLLFNKVHPLKVLSSIKDVSGVAKISNVSLTAESTICARIKTTQFYHERREWSALPQQSVVMVEDEGIETLTATDCDDIYEYCTNVIESQIGNGYIYGKAFAGLGQANYFPSWLPTTWNRLCIIFNESRLSVYLNEKVVLTRRNQNLTAETVNIYLMNNKNLQYPMQGFLTDFNIWNRKLSFEEVKSYSSCLIKGNTLNWNSIEVEKNDIEEIEIDQNEICNDLESKIISFDFGLIPLKDVKILCKNIGGNVAVAANEEAMAKMTEETMNLNLFENLFFSGICYNRKNGFYEVNSGKPVSPMRPLLGFSVDTAGCMWTNQTHFYLSQTTSAIHPICNVTEIKAFRLRGVCEDVDFDTYFVMLNPHKFVGYINSNITFSKEREQWEMVDHSSSVVAVLKDSDSPLGSQEWFFSEKYQCSDVEDPQSKGLGPPPYPRTLKLHLENAEPGEFVCNNAVLIDSDNVCDGTPDCDQEEDEQNCSEVTVPSYYDQTKPPITLVRENFVKTVKPSNLEMNMTILDVLEVNEKDSKIVVFYDLHLKWFDQNLEFEYLKPGEQTNEIQDYSRIWVPDLKFFHILEQEIVKKTLTVKRNELIKPTISGDEESIDVREVYEGQHNALELNIKMRQDVVCSFENIIHYPFRDESCELIMFIGGQANKMVNIDPYFIEDRGPVSVNQFLVNEWRISGDTMTGSTERIMRIQLILSRKLSNIFLITYLPTILMNVINQATNYINIENKVRRNT